MKGLRLPTAAAVGNIASALPEGIRDLLRRVVLLAHVRASVVRHSECYSQRRIE
jgi:hypothetical protein